MFTSVLLLSTILFHATDTSVEALPDCEDMLTDCASITGPVNQGGLLGGCQGTLTGPGGTDIHIGWDWCPKMCGFCGMPRPTRGTKNGPPDAIPSVTVADCKDSAADCAIITDVTSPNFLLGGCEGTLTGPDGRDINIGLDWCPKTCGLCRTPRSNLATTSATNPATISVIDCQDSIGDCDVITDASSPKFLQGGCQGTLTGPDGRDIHIGFDWCPKTCDLCRTPRSNLATTSATNPATRSVIDCQDSIGDCDVITDASSPKFLQGGCQGTLTGPDGRDIHIGFDWCPLTCDLCRTPRSNQGTTSSTNSVSNRVLDCTDSIGDCAIITDASSPDFLLGGCEGTLTGPDGRDIHIGFDWCPLTCDLCRTPRSNLATTPATNPSTSPFIDCKDSTADCATITDASSPDFLLGGCEGTLTAPDGTDIHIGLDWCPKTCNLCREPRSNPGATTSANPATSPVIDCKDSTADCAIITDASSPDFLQGGCDGTLTGPDGRDIHIGFDWCPKTCDLCRTPKPNPDATQAANPATDCEDSIGECAIITDASSPGFLLGGCEGILTGPDDRDIHIGLNWCPKTCGLCRTPKSNPAVTPAVNPADKDCKDSIGEDCAIITDVSSPGFLQGGCEGILTGPDGSYVHIGWDWCQLTCDYCNVPKPGKSTAQDIEPPSLTCPALNPILLTDKWFTNVTWNQPVYHDNSGMEGGQNATHNPPLQLPVGNHEVVFSAWDKAGNTATCSIIIQIIATCPEISAVTQAQYVSWPQAPAIDELCPSDQRCDVNTTRRGESLAYRSCMLIEQQGGEWSAINYTGCGIKDEANLEKISEMQVADSNVQVVSGALYSLTGNLMALTTKELEDVAQTIENIAEIEDITMEVLTDVVGIVNNVVTTSPGQQDPEITTNPVEQDANTEHLQEILTSFEDQIVTFSEAGQSLEPIVEPNIVVTSTQTIPTEDSTGSIMFVILEAGADGFMADDVMVFQDGDDVAGVNVRSSISLPATIFNTSITNSTLGVNFIAYSTTTLFPSRLRNQTVSGDILSAIITGGAKFDNLVDPVVLEFTVSGHNPVCVYWDFDMVEWSTEGCQLAEQTVDKVVCNCYHLTNFAVLVDATFTDTHIVLDIISKIGCGLSIGALLITIFIYSVFRRLRTGANSTPRKILLHLCFALILLYIFFLVGIDLVSNRDACVFIAALLQYLTLASLLWMGVEAYHMYMNVVKVFDNQPKHFILKAALFAWGIPMLITSLSVGLAFGVGTEAHYDHMQYCFVATGPVLFYGLLLPIGAILLFNLITFTRVMYRLCQSNIGGTVTNQSKVHTITRRLQNAFMLSILMGLTWVFGFFAIEDAKFVLSLIFCIFNSLQGVFIFILFCVRQEDVQKTIFPFCVKDNGSYDVKSANAAASLQSRSTMISRVQSTHIYDETSDFEKVIPATDCAVDNATYDAFIPQSEYHELDDITKDVYGKEEVEVVHGEDEDDYMAPKSPLIINLTSGSAKPRLSSSSSQSSQKKLASPTKKISASSMDDSASIPPNSPPCPPTPKGDGSESGSKLQKEISVVYAVSAKTKPTPLPIVEDNDYVEITTNIPTSPLIEKESTA